MAFASKLLSEFEWRRICSMNLSVKEAVAFAREYVRDLYGDEDIRYVGLEEVRFDDTKEEWLVTIGFSRPWDEERVARPAVGAGGFGGGRFGIVPIPRQYKMVRISDSRREVLSVTNREIAD